ncbi:gamma-secretase aspartyl protease complex, presenilin enhancer-2 subunit [Circinella umbellata]|nr:gamma-secretase aspartyl protease complex, presenilin enhancer-2 subunit [Circinella umbellata]
MSADELVSISKKMFYGGLAFLPFLWLINFMYLFRTSRKPSAPPALKKYVYLSMAGCVAWFVAMTTWYAVYVNKRTSWGAAGDQITVVIPKGV